jgi:hypothetical protein
VSASSRTLSLSRTIEVIELLGGYERYALGFEQRQNVMAQQRGWSLGKLFRRRSLGIVIGQRLEPNSARPNTPVMPPYGSN